jgi:hypothetical protein
MKRPEAKSKPAFMYTNRLGTTFYLHQGKTKTGKTRYYVAKTLGDGALAALPSGFDVSESINGVVSVRRKRDETNAIPDADVASVAAELSVHPHLEGYVARGEGDAIVVFEPHPRPSELKKLAQMLGAYRPATFVTERLKRAQYTPVLKFERDGASYAVHRMTYRGHGGWSWSLQVGALNVLAKTFLPKVGTDDFFELV